ncbi:MAG: TetR/AcrR family transcriptional regulator, partial [Polyangiaceae bacterium]|nr:TetR/AcrR family transcriptional regulator [Polyangiaceae bacterium]
ARLLPARGYAGVTTNHIASAAGVGIASVYEYFPGKDAIVAQVAERFVRRVLARLEVAVPGILRSPPEGAVRRWIEIVYATLEREKKLLAVFVYEVPYTNRLEPFRAAMPMLVEFSLSMRARLGARVTFENEGAEIYLMVNLVSSTIQQLVLDPPRDISKEEVIAALAARIESWIWGR